MSHTHLWEAWPTQPQTVLNPDALDAVDNFNAFYGMSARYHAGIYWCTLWVFRFNDNIYTELVTSRNGLDFNRAPIRQPLIPLGDEGQWDSYMIFASPDWVEVVSGVSDGARVVVSGLDKLRDGDHVRVGETQGDP